MNEATIEAPIQSGRLTGREARTQSIATRFTLEEEKVLIKRAEAAGQNLREWAREVLLRGAGAEDRDDMTRYLFTELVGIQLLLMNALEPLLTGEKLPRERVLAIYREVQSTKPGRARELLARRAREQEE